MKTSRKWQWMVSVIIAARLVSFCNANDLVKVVARQTDDSISFWIENASDAQIVYLGNPELSGFTIMAKSDKFEGKLKSSIPMAKNPGKNVILLTGKEEDMPHRWSHKLTVNAVRNEIGKLTNLKIVMWALPEKDYALILEKGGNIIPKLKKIEVSAEIKADP